MGSGPERILKRIPAGGFIGCVRSLYKLLGNRRKYERLPASGNIFAICKGVVVDTTYACSCVDISPRGIAIDSMEPMAVDALLRLRSDEHGPRRLARVRYCIRRSASYRIGLQFIADEDQA